MKNKKLTTEEITILNELSRGKNYHEIADETNMPVCFLMAFLTFIYKKLAVKKSFEAVKTIMQFDIEPRENFDMSRY